MNEILYVDFKKKKLKKRITYHSARDMYVIRNSFNVVLNIVHNMTKSLRQRNLIKTDLQRVYNYIEEIDGKTKA